MSYIDTPEFKERAEKMRERAARSRAVFERTLFGIETAKTADEPAAVSPEEFAGKLAAED